MSVPYISKHDDGVGTQTHLPVARNTSSKAIQIEPKLRMYVLTSVLSKTGLSLNGWVFGVQPPKLTWNLHGGQNGTRLSNVASFAFSLHMFANLNG